MYDTIIDLMQELFFFTWFMILATWLIGMVVTAHCVNTVRIEIHKLSESHRAEKAELKRALARRQGR